MHLDHDHRKSENVRFLAMCPLVYDLWHSPSQGVTMLTRGTLHGIQVLSDCSETKIHDMRSAGVIYEDVLLARCQYGSKM